MFFIRPKLQTRQLGAAMRVLTQSVQKAGLHTGPGLGQDCGVLV